MDLKLYAHYFSFEYTWVTIPLLLIPILFVIIQMAIIRIWMLTSPVKKRERPEYSLHVMKERKEKPRKVIYAPQLPIVPAKSQSTIYPKYQIASVPHSYQSARSGSSSRQSSGLSTPAGYMTPSRQFYQYQSGYATPQKTKPPVYGR
ncbi:hypothetical protein LSH36_145g04065 [Paralvinella palmiformis]|uniref:Uncharacterized protein n=1 Tax=Paralvinella palmiformis TaxID=53620 RepID=A0AAD9N8Y9_9ANNE|nr:hypothetical protein LSH36_145g04065 [Paralvinella palmiformis]